MATQSALQPESCWPERAAVRAVRVPARWLTPARAAWWVLAVYPAVLFVLGLAPAIEQLRVACDPGACTSTHWFALTPQQARSLAGNGISLEIYALAMTTLEVVQALVYAGCGLLIFLRRSDEWIALISSLVLVLLGVFLIPNTPSQALLTYPGLAPLVKMTFVWGNWLFPALLFLLPDGRFVPRWSRWVFVLHGTALTWVILVIDQAMPQPVQEMGMNLGRFVFLASSLVGIGGQVYRYQRVATPVMRQQIKWIALGIAGFLLSFVLDAIIKPLPASVGDLPLLTRVTVLTAMLACMALLPLCLTLAVVRYHLWDADVVLNRALVYGGLTAAVAALYAVVVGGLSAIFHAQSNAVVAIAGAGLVAVLFQPLRQRIQRIANHLMFGQRDEPYAVLTQFGRQLESTPALETLLPAIVATIEGTLKLPHVEITMNTDQSPANSLQSAASGGKSLRSAQDGQPVAFPLVYQGVSIGRLVVSSRDGETTLSRGDRRLLEDLARQAGAAIHAAGVTVELQRARQRLVTAREEERRRLRRDLHDGLGPTLAAMAAQSEAARDLIPTHPELSATLLNDVVAQAQTATADIRRLVYNLRPPALDDLGLAGAIRGQAAKISQPDGLIIGVQAGALPPLPAAVEVAAYFIAQEAMTNVARHARARGCTVTVAAQEDHLTLEVRDDGRGLGQTAEAGVGIRSMRERALELGGQLAMTSNGDGTTVQARLPLAPGATGGPAGRPSNGTDLMAQTTGARVEPYQPKLTSGVGP